MSIYDSKLTVKERVAKYSKSKYWSPAYNAVFGFHQGSFFKALGEAIYKADSENSAILKKAYPELYKIMAFLDNMTTTDVQRILEEIKNDNSSK